jgi:hypothetical protein
MPSGRRSEGHPSWVIRSVPVRTRDGPERLDQAYRRLMDDIPRRDPPPASGFVPGWDGPAPLPEPRR